MFGLSRNDAAQQHVVETFRDGMMPYRGGYAIKLSRKEPAVAITAGQRDALVEAYAVAFNRAMRVMMAITIVALVCLAGWLVRSQAKPAFWQVLIVILLGASTMIGPQRALRRTVLSFGPRPTVLESEYQAFQRRRVREQPWSTILLPMLVMPFIAWRFHMDLPPREADDYAELAFMVAIFAVFLWAVARKLKAGQV